jgi:hypothetical protein
MRRLLQDALTRIAHERALSAGVVAVVISVAADVGLPLTADQVTAINGAIVAVAALVLRHFVAPV